MSQIVVLVVISVAAMLAMPQFYEHRSDDMAFMAGLAAFIGGPLLAGLVPKVPHRSLLPIALGLLFLCPIVYAVTDPLPVEFEKSRDAYFLAAGSSIVFVSTIWLASSIRSRRWAIAIFAALGLALSAVGIFVLLALVLYLE